MDDFREGCPVQFPNLYWHRGQDSGRAGLVGEQPHLAEDVPPTQTGDSSGREVLADHNFDNATFDQVQAIGNLAFSTDWFAGSISPRFGATEDFL